MRPRRAPQQVALAVVATQFAQGLPLRLGLDSFADGFDAQRASDSTPSTSARALHFRPMQASDETLVDLQRADRETVQVGQRGEARTEIVQLHLMRFAPLQDAVAASSSSATSVISSRSRCGSAPYASSRPNRPLNSAERKCRGDTLTDT